MNTVIKGRGNMEMRREGGRAGAIGLAWGRDRELRCSIYKAQIYEDGGGETTPSESSVILFWHTWLTH